MDNRAITRRRVLTVAAAAGTAMLIPQTRSSRPVEWRGTALGADARMLLWSSDVSAAREAIAACLSEIERLEAIFSLFQPQSEISRLNRTRVLTAASLDMRNLLRACRRMNAATGGLFDPTVQRLWRNYASWFAGGDRDEGPPSDRIASLIDKIGMSRVAINAGTVRLAEGTELTLNGIAQGYITDRVAEILKARGWSNVLIDIGETRALGARADRSPWRIWIRDSRFGVPLANQALATSCGAAMCLSGDGRITHLLDPGSGRSPHHWQSITVQHPLATVADALSTGLFVAPADRLTQMARRVTGAQVWATAVDGRRFYYGSLS